jgi:ribonuclease BN (tRNA processing enzyme)
LIQPTARSFTGDTGPSLAVAELAKGADLLVSEVTVSPDELREQMISLGQWQLMTAEQQSAFMRHQREEHLFPDEVGKIAARAGVKVVVLTHITDTGNPNDDYARLAEQVKKYFSGQVLRPDGVLIARRSINPVPRGPPACGQQPSGDAFV